MKGGMVFYWPKFRKQRFFLLCSYARHTALLVASVALVRHFNVVLPRLSTSAAVALAPLALYLGVKLPTIMHQCMHGSLRSGNRVVGELTASLVLLDFAIVSILHTLHHRFADTEHDPHRPGGASFWQYFFASQMRGTRVAAAWFGKSHGETRANRWLFGACTVLHFSNSLLRLHLLAAVLGTSFYDLYLPAYAGYLFVFAHVNFYTHQGQILNLDGNLYYRLCNRLFDGIYFHENHHLDPKALNPMSAGG